MPDAFRNPHDLPTRICAACRRPFAWRKRWERNWDAVRYCSERCRRAGSSGDTRPDPADSDPASDGA